MTDITNNTILKLNANVVKRFEHNLKDGTMILCNMKNFDFWFGNCASKELIKLINGENTINDIYSELLSHFESDDYKIAIEAYNKIIEDLYEKNFIEVINND